MPLGCGPETTGASGSSLTFSHKSRGVRQRETGPQRTESFSELAQIAWLERDLHSGPRPQGEKRVPHGDAAICAQIGRGHSRRELPPTPQADADAGGRTAPKPRRDAFTYGGVGTDVLHPDLCDIRPRRVVAA